MIYKLIIVDRKGKFAKVTILKISLLNQFYLKIDLKIKAIATWSLGNFEIGCLHFSIVWCFHGTCQIVIWMKMYFYAFNPFTVSQKQQPVVVYLLVTC